MDLIADLLIVNDCNRFAVVNNEVLKEMYNQFRVHCIQTLIISIMALHVCTLGQHYSYNPVIIKIKINKRSIKHFIMYHALNVSIHSVSLFVEALTDTGQHC